MGKIQSETECILNNEAGSQGRCALSQPIYPMSHALELKVQKNGMQPCGENGTEASQGILPKNPQKIARMRQRREECSPMLLTAHSCSKHEAPSLSSPMSEALTGLPWGTSKPRISTGIVTRRPRSLCLAESFPRGWPCTIPLRSLECAAAMHWECFLPTMDDRSCQNDYR